LTTNESTYAYIESQEMDSLEMGCLGVADSEFPDGSPSVCITLQDRIGCQPVFFYEMDLKDAEHFLEKVQAHLDTLRERTREHGTV
jgi:hypothetical protein